MLGLRRLKLDAIWLELLPGTNDPRADQANIDNFQRRLREHGLGGRYCLLFQKPASDAHDLDEMRCIGISRRELIDRLAGPNALLNLSYSIHPPLLLQFERRIFCDLDPSEIFYWMTKMELGQSHHHEFWTIGLNVHGRDCRLPQSGLHWKTFYPLVDTKLYRPARRPLAPRFTTIGQWYWGGSVEVNGTFPDLSKKFAFEPYLDLPKRIPEARFELAMNIKANDPEKTRLQSARLARCRSAPRCADTERLPAIHGRRSRRIHRYQRRGRSVADRLAKRPGSCVSCPRTAGDHGGHRRRKISAAGERIPFCPRRPRRGNSSERSAAGLGETLEAGAQLRGGNLRFGEESPPDSRPLGTASGTERGPASPPPGIVQPGGKPHDFGIAKQISGVTRCPVMADLMKAAELKDRMKKIPEWELEKKHIERSFEFDDFADAIDFVNSVAEVAEDEEHHPDIDIRYNKVRLVLSTHSKGGLTELDFALAERIDTLAE